MSKVAAFPLPPASTAGDTILRLPRVKDRTGVSKAFIYAGVKKGTFPAPIKLTDDGRTVGWLASSVDGWIQSRIQSGRQQVAV